MTYSACLIAMTASGLWLGGVLAMSFLKTPIRFTAPHVPRLAALSIGRRVLRAVIWAAKSSGCVPWFKSDCTTSHAGNIFSRSESVSST
jgi:hypothetical protein